MIVEKAARLERQRLKALRNRHAYIHSVYQDYVTAQPLNFVAPPIADIAVSKVFRSLIVDTPYDTDLSAWSYICEQLPAIIAEWRARKDAELLGILKQHVPGATLAHLRLASTVFICAGHTGPYGSPCAERLTYPRVLVHGCTSSREYRSPAGPIWLATRYKDRHTTTGAESEPADSTSSDDGTLMAIQYLGSVPWNYGGGRIAFSVSGSRNARAAVEACGLDPEVATVSDMDTLNPILECRDCLSDHAGRLMMRWMQTVCLIL